MTKVIIDSGVYYRFTVTDQNKKKVVVKIDDLHSRSQWNAVEWVDK
jgi:hypothetical protein